MKFPIPIGIILLLIFGVFVGLAITPVAADTVMTIYEFQVTTNAASQENPDIDDVHIVWQDNRNGNWDIYLYTLMSSLAPETRITTNSSSQEFPAVSGNYIVWQDNRNGNWDIYLYDITNKTETQITTSIANQQYPAISGNCVVWQDDRNGNWDIYLYDIGTQTETLLTRSCYPTACPSKYPAIYANNILYQKTWAPLSIWEPCLFKVDPATGVETYLSAWVNNNNDPHIAIYQNRAVWTVYEYIYDGYHTSIWMYDLNTGSMTRITDFWGHVTYNEGHPDTDGYAPAYIVYYDNRNHNEDIFVYNLDRETETQVTNNTSNQRDPAISGGRIVFMDDRNGNWDIYMAMLGWSNPPPGSEPSETGSLYVASYPNGATILINGTGYGTTNQVVKDVPAGNQNLTLIKTGYQPFTTVVDVPAGALKTLAPITLTKSGDGVPGGTGTLYVMSSPTGATILINGTGYGTTNQFVKDVPAGNQNLTLIKTGYQPYTTVVDVPAGGMKALGPITLTKDGGASPDGTGTLYIMSSPTGARIFMNGTDYGTTNQFVKDVPAGAQTLVLFKEGYQPKVIQVDVPAGGMKVLGPITLSPGTLPGGTIYPGTIQRAYSSYPCYTLTYSDASQSYTVYLPANEITYAEGGYALPNPIPNPVAVDYVGPIDSYHYTLDFRYQGVIYSAHWYESCPQENPYVWGDANHCNIPFEDKYFGTVYVYSWDLAKNDWVKTPAEGVLVTIYARDCDPPCGTGEIFEVGTTHSDADGKWHKTTGQTYSGEGYVTYSLAGYPPGQDDLDNAPFCIED